MVSWELLPGDINWRIDSAELSARLWMNETLNYNSHKELLNCILKPQVSALYSADTRALYISHSDVSNACFVMLFLFGLLTASWLFLL